MYIYLVYIDKMVTLSSLDWHHRETRKVIQGPSLIQANYSAMESNTICVYLVCKCIHVYETLVVDLLNQGSPNYDPLAVAELHIQ